MKRIALASALALLGLCSGGVAHAQSTLKIATLAPEGSAWMVAFHEWAKNVEEHTGGKVKVKFFAGGTAGDERDAVRKMRLGQLNGAAVTAIGLGLINSEVRVLELPMLIDNYDELDYVRNKLDAELRKKFEDKGYVLLAWGDVGPVHIFSNSPIKGKADLAQLKLWAWVDDALVRALFHAARRQRRAARRARRAAVACRPASSTPATARRCRRWRCSGTPRSST